MGQEPFLLQVVGNDHIGAGQNQSLPFPGVDLAAVGFVGGYAHGHALDPFDVAAVRRKTNML